MKDFKYKTTFQAQAEIVKPDKKSREALASIFSKSSHLEGLAGLFPSADEIENNPDLLFFTCNAATPNFANLNDDLVLGSEGLNLLKGVKYKQVNIEHQRDSIVGVLIGGGISSFEDSKLISHEEALASKQKFNLSVMGCIFRVAAGELCDSIEDSANPESENYKKISVSWEVGFNDYGVLIGSKEASSGIIKLGEDAKPYLKYLRAEGGAGMDDNGLEVYRIIENAIFLGVGLTTNPAAAVSGILTYQEKTETEEESKSEDMEEEAPEVEELETEEEDDEEEKTKIKVEIEVEVEASEDLTLKQTEASEKNIKKDEKIISTFKESPVIKTVTKMKFENIEQIYASLEAHASDISAKDMREFLEGAFSKANEQYLAEKAAKAEAETKLQETLANADEAKLKADNLESELNEIKASLLAKEVQDTFDKRFGALAEQYDLEDEKVRAFVAKSIRDLDEEGFAHWKDNDGLIVLASREKKKGAANIDEATAAMKEAQANIDIPNSQDLDKTEESFLSLANEISFKLKK